MEATEVAKKGVATGCDRKRCFRPVETVKEPSQPKSLSY